VRRPTPAWLLHVARDRDASEVDDLGTDKGCLSCLIGVLEATGQLPIH